MASEDVPPIIEVVGFSKSYGGLKAVDGLDFDVGRGEIVGLIGANGAGKTTTLQSLAGLLKPDEGSLRVCGRCVTGESIEVKRRLAYIPDSNNPYDLLTVSEHLTFVGLAYSVPSLEAKIDHVLEEVGLVEKRDQQASTLSRGMVQKLSLACALIWDPAVIVLDEPLTGLDPRGIRAMKDLVRSRAKAGMSFLLSSHLLELVETICQRVLIVDRGRRIAFGSLAEIRASLNLSEKASMEDIYLAMTMSD